MNFSDIFQLADDYLRTTFIPQSLVGKEFDHAVLHPVANDNFHLVFALFQQPRRNRQLKRRVEHDAKAPPIDLHFRRILHRARISYGESDG